MTTGYSPKPWSWTGRNSATVPTVISAHRYRSWWTSSAAPFIRTSPGSPTNGSRCWENPERFPEEWDGFRDRCHHAGQTTPTPILLKYGPGGFNALHRDLRGAVFFPIQMAVVLSPRADPDDADTPGFHGGEFLFCDSPEGRKSRHREVVLGLGDAVLFCTRDRLVRMGGVVGLQPVKHGAAPITAGTRFLLGVPFHEYR